MTDALTNWSGTYTFRAPTVVDATSIDEVVQAVRGADRVRSLGTRHSFNPIADSEGTLVTVTGIDPDPVLDEDARTVTVGGGTRYGVLAAWLEEHGWALHNMGSLPHISIAGAISTGTHGSGDLLGNLSSAVRAITFVRPDGEIETVDHAHPDFAGSVVALGRLGTIVRITLAIEPSYLVRQDVYRGLDWDVLLDDPRSVTGAAYSVSVFTNWIEPKIDKVFVKRRLNSADEVVSDDLFGAVRNPSGQVPILEAPDDNTTQQGVAGAWALALPHFRLDSQPSNGDEIQTEYFVPADRGAEALRAVKALGERIAPHLLITELRTMSADTLWLSPAYGRDSLAIHFTWKKDPEAVLALLPDIQAALEPFDVRPHWGKVHTLTAADIAPRYPHFQDALDLFARVDPAGKLRNAYTDQVLGA